ncbi:MAG: hypothetical protein IPF58_03595 [Saprospirales bacterium]|nr:hypothetical protein [Saprospirales bacterium]
MKKIVFTIAFIFPILFSFSKNELRLDSISKKDTTKFLTGRSATIFSKGLCQA